MAHAWWADWTEDLRTVKAWHRRILAGHVEWPLDENLWSSFGPIDALRLGRAAWSDPQLCHIYGLKGITETLNNELGLFKKS
eukprot:6109518-Amphidinium_carterae.1